MFGALLPYLGWLLPLAASVMAQSAGGLPNNLPDNAVRNWLAVLFYMLGGLFLGIKLWKEIFRDPSPDKKYVLRGEFDLLDAASQNRAKSNSERIDKLEQNLEGKHAQNVKRGEDILSRLDRNFEETRKAHDELRKEVRHDVREEVQGLQSKLDMNRGDTEEQFRSILGQIGALKKGEDYSAALAAEVRAQLTNIASRLPKGGARA